MSKRYSFGISPPWTRWPLGAAALAATGLAWAQPDDDRPADTVRTTQYQEMPTTTTDSDTGYIDNAVLGTRFRLRYEAASDIDKPDRAEFFYAKCGCFRGAGDPVAPGPVGPALDIDGDGTITDEEVLASPLIENSLDYDLFRLDIEYAIGRRWSAFVEIPYLQIDGAAIPSASGFGDIRAGFKYALRAAPNEALTLQLRAYFPSGDAGDGLGTDHYSLEPAVLWYKRINPRATLNAEFRVWVPIDGSSGAGTGLSGDFAGEVLRYGIGYSYDFGVAPAMQFTPVIELVGWTVLGGISSFSPDRTPNNLVVSDAEDTIVNLKIGARLKLDPHNSIYLGYGIALTDEVWYDDIWRLEYRSTR